MNYYGYLKTTKRTYSVVSQLEETMATPLRTLGVLFLVFAPLFCGGFDIAKRLPLDSQLLTLVGGWIAFIVPLMVVAALIGDPHKEWKARTLLVAAGLGLGLGVWFGA